MPLRNAGALRIVSATPMPNKGLSQQVAGEISTRSVYIDKNAPHRPDNDSKMSVAMFRWSAWHSIPVRLS